MNDVSEPTSHTLQAHSLVALAQAAIERMILSGEFSPGERINENALANELGISRGPVREACRTLAAQGLVELIPNRGVFIRVISDDDARNVYELRAGIFGYAGMLLAPRISDDQLDYLKTLIDQMEAAIQSRDFARYYAPNLTFHDFLVTATNNQRLVDGYHDLVRQLHLFRTRALMAGDGMAASHQEHQEILASLARRDPQGAFAAMTGHILQGCNRALASDSRQGNRIDA